jgi:predicted HicB family RNase H-like nuclease
MSYDPATIGGAGPGTRQGTAKGGRIQAVKTMARRTPREDDARHKAGGSSLTGESAVSPRVTFRITPDVRDRAAKIAEHDGKTISQLAREALKHE